MGIATPKNQNQAIRAFWLNHISYVAMAENTLLSGETWFLRWFTLKLPQYTLINLNLPWMSSIYLDLP